MFLLNIGPFREGENSRPIVVNRQLLGNNEKNKYQTHIPQDVHESGNENEKKKKPFLEYDGHSDQTARSNNVHSNAQRKQSLTAAATAREGKTLRKNRNNFKWLNLSPAPRPSVCVTICWRKSEKEVKKGPSGRRM